MKVLKPIFILVLVLCGRWIGAQTILVSAAVSLTNVLPEIATAFKHEHAGSDVHFNFASSGVLEQQIEHGAPADIFISAAQTQMHTLQHKGLIDSTSRRNVCRDVLVLIAPEGSALHTWNDLTGGDVTRIAIGDPTSVPAGMYTKQTLTALGLWEKLASKFVLAENVRQALTYVNGRNVSAGIVYLTDAMASHLVMIVCTAPEETHERILYPAAVISRSTQHALAKQFVEFLASPVAQTIFNTRGFKSPQ